MLFILRGLLPSNSRCTNILPTEQPMLALVRSTSKLFQDLTPAVPAIKLDNQITRRFRPTETLKIMRHYFPDIIGNYRVIRHDKYYGFCLVDRTIQFIK